MSITYSLHGHRTFARARAIITCAILAALLTLMLLGALHLGVHHAASWPAGAGLVDTSPTPLGCGGVTAGCH